MFFSFKRCISIVFILMILFINIFSCYSVAYADSQSSGGCFGSKTDLSVYNKIYDGFDFSDTIAKHESFYFTDSVGNKHAVARVGSAWICLFGSRATFNGSQDDLLNYYLSYYAYTGYRSISNSFCALMASQLGSISKGGYTLVENALSSNIKNVADNITYNESDDSISLNNSAVDKLREEIKEYYYGSVGIRFLHSSGDIKKAISTSYYDDMDLYTEDFKMLTDYDYAIFSKRWKVLFAFNKTDFNYLYFTQKFYNNDSSSNDVTIRNVDKNLDDVDLNISCSFNITPDNFSPYTIKSLGCFTTYGMPQLPSGLYFTNVAFDGVFGSNSSPDFFAAECYLYSKNDEDIMIFASYEALYNYLKSDQNAYLSKTINETGKDISFSIKDMNENLGVKMDTLIDSINSGKGNMSADELQDAIDKGIKDLNKNTEDIKDNTSDILDVLKEQNQILLDILGVTTNIYKVVKESDSKEKTYNINYVQSVFNSMFKGLKNAVLYGENTVRDDVSEDTDDIESIISDIPPDKKNYHNGLFGRFPFSVPYQLFDWLQALYVEPVAPKFTLSYAYLFRDLGYETNNFEFVIDLGDEKYSKWIELVRSGEKLSFIIYMAIATYHRFKNEI